MPVSVGRGYWVEERWWYRLAHVCQRWRNLILGSATYLGLCLVCTYGTPVADMLAHSPPFHSSSISRIKTSLQRKKRQ
ncbi:hypothetical protein BGY98DRAFT_986246, partial [Russula aff. rugulosa BPL654]